MGFFGALGKIIAGKPIYGPENTGTQGSGAGQPQPTTNQHGKLVPVLRVTRVESRINGGRMQVNLEIKNESPIDVLIDRVLLLGATCDMNYTLRAGSTYEFPIYSGPTPKNDSYDDAEVQYRTDGGDYFSARHQVLYQMQSDGLHIKELRLITPIKDLR